MQTTIRNGAIAGAASAAVLTLIALAPAAVAQFVPTKDSPIAYAADTFNADDANHMATAPAVMWSSFRTPRACARIR